MKEKPFRISPPNKKIEATTIKVVNDVVCHAPIKMGDVVVKNILGTGVDVIAAGHYCTEKPGVITVMEKIQQKFKIDCEFIDLPTGL